jgi:hypothetical protein
MVLWLYGFMAIWLDGCIVIAQIPGIRHVPGLPYHIEPLTHQPFGNSAIWQFGHITI